MADVWFTSDFHLGHFNIIRYCNLPDDPLSLSMDVGVDSHDFRPWHFDEIQAIMRVKAEAKTLHRQQIDTIR